MSSQPSRAAHRVSSPAELIDAIPYLLGFHPADSLVLVGLHDGMLVVTARLDLADAAVRPGPLESTLASMHRNGVRQLMAVVVDDACAPRLDAQDDLPDADIVLALEVAAAAEGIDLREVLLLGDGRWWSYLCGSPVCCPPEGTALVDAPSAFAAAATYAGVVPLADREALDGTLAPLPEAERSALEPLLADAEHAQVAAVLADRWPVQERALTRELLRVARASNSALWQVPDDRTVAVLAMALLSIPVRDEVWLGVDSRGVDGRRLWAELARRCPAPYDAAPLFLFGWASWRAGHGALAGMAAERALTADPGYSAADLLLAAVVQAVDPRTFPPLGEGRLDRRVRARRRRARRGGAAPTRR